MGTLYENIIDLCENKGIKGGTMCADLGISKGILTDLKAGRKKGLSAATANKIASYFDVSVGYLLGTETEKAPTTSGERFETDPDIRRIERARQNMTEKDRERMMNILKASFDQYFSDDFVDEDTDE